MFSVDIALVLGSIAAIVLTILLYIKVMPRKLDGTFEKPFFQKLHDFFHFKKLYLEEVLKFFYVLATVTVVCMGVFMMLSYYETYSWSYYGGGRTEKESLFLYGLLTVVTGPIALRLVYEVSMMFILLVKNTIEINNKMPKAGVQAPVVPVAPVAPAAPAAPAAPVVNVCAHCGKQLPEGASFCTGCGNKI